jgi:hypothetical protein
MRLLPSKLCTSDDHSDENSSRHGLDVRDAPTHRSVFQMSKDPKRQELPIQLAAIAESGRSVRDLNPTQRRELEGYVRQMV